MATPPTGAASGRFVPPTDEAFRTIFEHAAFAVALVDTAGHCLLSNPALHAWLGYSSEELASMSFVEFTHPDDADLDWRLYQQLVASERESYSLEKRYVTRRGDVVWGRITVSLVRAAPPRPLYTVALVEDITEQKRALDEEQAAVAALRESEERLRLATRAGHIGIFDWDVQTGVVSWSGELDGLLEVSPSSVPRSFDAFVTLLHPDDSARVIAQVMKVIASGEPYVDEYRLIRPDHTVCWIAAHAAVFRGPDDTPVRMTGTWVDTTARHAMAQQRMQAVHDLGERVKELTALHRTARLLQQTDLSTRELLEQLVELLPAAWQYPEVTAVRASFDGVVAASSSFSLTPWPALRVPFRTAEQREGLLEVVYLEARPDESIGPFVREQLDLLESVAEMLVAHFERQHHAEMQRRYALALARAQEDERRHIARELHDSVSQTLYAIALGAQTAHASLSEAGNGEAAEDALKYVQNLAGSALADMRALIFELRPQMLDQEGLVAAIERLIGSVVARQQFDVRPNLGAEPNLDVDSKEALYRIVQESLNNIARHAHARTVNVTLTAANRCVKLEVRDDGIGFDPTSGFPGHLGLISMRERASGIGATLSVQSAPGQGTTVRVELPAR